MMVVNYVYTTLHPSILSPPVTGVLSLRHSREREGEREREGGWGGGGDLCMHVIISHYCSN